MFGEGQTVRTFISVARCTCASYATVTGPPHHLSKTHESDAVNGSGDLDVLAPPGIIKR